VAQTLGFDLTVLDPPAHVTDVVGFLESRRVAMGSCRDARGGIQRKLVTAVVEHGLRSAGFAVGSDATLAAKELDFTHSVGTAVSVQAGRASANHGALFGVLAAAAAPSVDWLVLAVPTTYKGVNVLDPVVRELDDLRSSPGIRLDLQGVVIVDY
jgi:hypothetical protein